MLVFWWMKEFRSLGKPIVTIDYPNYPERRIRVSRTNKRIFQMAEMTGPDFSDLWNKWIKKKQFLQHAQGLNRLLSKLLAEAQILKMGTAPAWVAQ